MTIEQILEKFPATRSDDKKLLLAVWFFQSGLLLTPEQKKIFYNKCLMAESITRKRRDLQASGKYLGSPEIMKGRKVQEQLFRRTYGKTNSN